MHLHQRPDQAPEEAGQRLASREWAEPSAAPVARSISALPLHQLASPVDCARPGQLSLITDKRTQGPPAPNRPGHRPGPFRPGKWAAADGPSATRPSQRVADLGRPNLQGEPFVSLDLQALGTEEWQYVHAAPFSNWTLATSDPAGASFRQVSRDPAEPAFFCRNPSLVYGATGIDPASYWKQSCEIVAPLLPAELVEIVLARTLPAFPLADVATVRQALSQVDTPGASQVGLLTSMLAHVTTYVPQLRPLHKQLWRQALGTVEDESRRPRLQMLSLAMIIASSRPQIQLGQHVIALGRAAGVAFLLGLHRDPEKWMIPKWERSLRRRLWWCLLIHDKWRGLLHGRPSMIHISNHNVALPTLDDAEDRKMSAAEVTSFESFIAMCKLNQILDRYITLFQPEHEPLPDRPTQLTNLQTLSQQLAELEHALPAQLKLSAIPSPAPAPTGVRSFQLCQLAFSTHLVQRTVEAIEPRLVWQKQAALRGALELCTTLVHFIEGLRPEEMDGWWLQVSSHHLSICAALILRTAIQTKASDPDLSTQCCALVTRFVSSLLMQHHSYHWDVASLGLDRIFRLLRSAEGDLPEVASLVAIYGPPNLQQESESTILLFLPTSPLRHQWAVFCMLNWSFRARSLGRSMRRHPGRPRSVRVRARPVRHQPALVALK